MSVVVLGGNRFVECASILAYKGAPLLKVQFDPLRLELTTPPGIPSGIEVRVDEKGASPPDRVRIIATSRSFAIFWQDLPLAVATLLDPGTAHLHLHIDLRPLGINIFDDIDGLHIGDNVFSGNVISHAAAAINLGD